MLKKYYQHYLDIYIFLKGAVIFSINYKFTTILLKELKLKDETQTKDNYNQVYRTFRDIDTVYVNNFETVLKHFIKGMNKITDYFLTEFKSGVCTITNKDYVLLLNHVNILNLYNLTLNLKNNDSNPVSYKYYKGPGNKSIFYKYMNIKYNKHLFDTKYYLNEKEGIEHAHSKLMNDYFMVYNKNDFNKLGANMYEEFTFEQGHEDNIPNKQEELIKLTPKMNLILTDNCLLVDTNKEPTSLEYIGGEDTIENILSQNYTIKGRHIGNERFLYTDQAIKNIYIYQHIYSIPEEHYKFVFPENINNYDYEKPEYKINNITEYYNKIVIVIINDIKYCGFIDKKVKGDNSSVIKKHYILFKACKNYTYPENEIEQNKQVTIRKNMDIKFYKLLPNMLKKNIELKPTTPTTPTGPPRPTSSASSTHENIGQNYYKQNFLTSLFNNV